MTRLDNKVAIITGGASGMGKIASERFVAEGARVVVVDYSEAAGHAVAASLGDRATFIAADVSKAADCDAMVAHAMSTFGALHVLYNNAGVFPDDDGGVMDTPESTWERVMEINLKGVWLGCRSGIPAMVESGGGSIVNVASFVALMGAATAQIAYTASKGGVLAMTREIAVEWARKGIRANSLCPGPVDTPLLAPLMSDPARKARRMIHIPMGRLAHAEEIVNAALFLASDEASYITGSQLVVDGGITAAYVTPE